MKRWLHNGHLFLEMGFEKQVWVALLTAGSLITWFAIRLFKMKRFCAFFGDYQENQSMCVLATKEQRGKAWQIGRTMDVVTKNVPWECKCLAEALCVKWLLDRYHIPSATYLGAYLDTDEKAGIKAHAWLTVNDYVVIGGPGHEEHQVTSVFTQTYAGVSDFRKPVVRED
jgi:hypothetical protein